MLLRKHYQMLRYIILIVILIVPCTALLAQGKLLKHGAVGFAYHSYRYGRGINLTYRYELPYRFSLMAGIKYHINDRTTYNTPLPDPAEPEEPEAHIDRYYAIRLGQRLGFKLGIERSFPIKLRYTELFGYYDFQYTQLNSQSIDYGYSHTDTFPDGHIIVYSEKSYLAVAKYHCFENHLGIGARFAVSDQCSVTLQVGAGFFIPVSRRLTNVGSGVVYEFDSKPGPFFSRMYGVGIEYKLNRLRSAGHR